MGHEVFEENCLATGFHRSRLDSKRNNTFKTKNQHRKLSTASSPCSFRVWTTEAGEDIDHYGYVLPGSRDQTERVRRICHPTKKNSKSFMKNLSPLMIKQPQEYEIMGKKGSASSCGTRGITTKIDAPLVALGYKMTTLPSPTSIAPLLLEDIVSHMETPVISVTNKTVDEDCTEAAVKPEVAEQLNVLYGNTGTGDEQKEAVPQIDRYEYLDIKCSNSLEENESSLKSRESETSLVESAETEETCQELQTHADIIVNTKPDVPITGEEKEDDYEEMTSGSNGWEQPMYQNLPKRDKAVSEELGGTKCAGIEGYIKVCAAIGEPENNTSFDNPDYWHSRLFLKPDALRI
ncbi:hypothetical protein NL108_001524 [Boleophthalmus pectinirostris]|nr:hypothetical protein NL108_001524 [Boleophthalmus pectinirostris]